MDLLAAWLGKGVGNVIPHNTCIAIWGTGQCMYGTVTPSVIEYCSSGSVNTVVSVESEKDSQLENEQVSSYIVSILN